ncbi:MAG: radical SAM protein [Candidatus Thermoplasmatota archaeon]
MNILLINANMYHRHSWTSQLLYKLNSNPILVLQQLAAATPQNHRVRLIDDRYDNPLINDPVDLVGISTVTPSSFRAYEIAEFYRKKGIPVVLGGIHPSALPEEAKQHADAVVIGEAESTWPQVIADVEKGKLQPFYRAEQPVPPELIPQPRRDLLRLEPLFSAVAPSRGCPYYCSFCTLTHLHGNTYRARPIEHIVDEIKNTPRKFLVFLHDASLTINREYAKALLKAMIPLKRKFIAYGSAPVLAQDDELLKLSYDAGCVIWCVGFESICQDSLKQDAHKGYSVENYEKMVKKIHANHMSVFGSFVFGFDHDTPAIFDATLQKAFDFGLDAAEFNILTPFPITRLFKKLDSEGRILTRDWTLYDLHHVVFQPKLMTADELYQGAASVSNRFYAPDKTLARIANVTFKTRKFPNILVVSAMNVIMARFHLEFTLF